MEQFGDLPSRNVSVRVVTSIPTVSTNSTDLNFLRNKGIKKEHSVIAAGSFFMGVASLY